MIRDIGGIHASQLARLEKITRFHYEFDINWEGIETIIHLLERMYALQADMTALKNKFRLYGDDKSVKRTFA